MSPGHDNTDDSGEGEHMSKKKVEYVAVCNIGTDPVTLVGQPVKVGKTADAIDPDKLQAFIDAGLITEATAENGDTDSTDGQ